MVIPPETSYAWNEGTALAYQVVGSGPDLLFVPGSVTHLEVQWDEPRVSRFLKRLAGFCRLILMDPRGLGLSDRLTDIPTLDERVGDVLAVLDAAGSERRRCSATPTPVLPVSQRPSLIPSGSTD